MPTTKINKNEFEWRVEMAGKLASVEGKIDTLDAKLTPILTLQTTVTEHDRQINKWIGVNSVLSGILALTVAFFASFYAKWKHLF